MDSMLYLNGEFVSDNEDAVDTAPEAVDLKPCPVCSRTFVPVALEKHVNICEKMTVQKRMPFDSFRQRRKGIELTHYLPSTYGTTIKSKSNKQQVNSSGVSSIHEPIQRISDKTHRISPKFDSYKAETPLMTRSLKRTLGPLNEVCLHCGRSFGSRSYDRHVEWCKERSKITNPTLSSQQHLAKERMQARTKYKAPMLRSKREKNREKYSSLSESMNNLSESGDMSILDFNSVIDPFETDRKSSVISLSMSSSIASDGPISNKYDPFISAKRQFDDLFSTTTANNTSTPVKGLESLATITMSSSVQSPPNSDHDPVGLSKSSFRRTSSLRAPKKTSSISFVPKYKPNIQRGISDEGPISSNFMKPEEFDELPVKCHAIIPPDLVPKTNAAKQLNRENAPIIGRANSKMLKRKNLSLDSHNKTNDFQLIKTDSLAAFLEFENDLEYSTSIEKTQENNGFHKNVRDDEMNILKENDNNALQIIHSDAVKLLPIEKPLIMLLNPMGRATEFNNNSIQFEDNDDDESIVSNLSNSCDNLRISNTTRISNDSYDRKQQSNEGGLGTSAHRFCSKLGGSSSTESIDSHKNMENIVNLRNITDSEKRNPKRQLRFQKDNLLFENCQYDQHLKNNNDSCRDNFIEDKDIPNNVCKTDLKINRPNQLNQRSSADKRQNHESIFDDFNLEEFISSFSDNEQFPIFKNYKESMRSMIVKTESTSEDSNSKDKNKLEENNQSKDSNPIVHETCDEKPSGVFTQNIVVGNILKKPDVTVAEEQMKLEKLEVTQLSSNRGKALRDDQVDKDRVTDTERALLKSVHELKLMCNVNTMDEQDSISLSSQNNQLDVTRPFNSTTKEEKLFQHSPNEKSSVLGYQKLAEPIEIHPGNAQNEYKLPVRSPPLEQIAEKPDSNKTNLRINEPTLSPITLHKNDSQNIYSTMNMTTMTKKPYSDLSKLSLGFNSFSGNTKKLSKFCHECGAKFIVDQAKFCMECGVKRVTVD